MKITLSGDNLFKCVEQALKTKIESMKPFSAYHITQAVRQYVGNVFNVEHQDVKKIVHERMKCEKDYVQHFNGTYIEYKYEPKTQASPSTAGRIPVGTTGKFFVGDLVKIKDDSKYYLTSAFQGKPRKIVKTAGISNDSWIWCDFDGVSLWTYEDELELVPTEPVIQNQPAADPNQVITCRVNKAGLHLPKSISDKLAYNISVKLKYSQLPGESYYTYASKDSRGDFRLSRKKLNLAPYIRAIAKISVTSIDTLDIKIKVN